MSESVCGEPFVGPSGDELRYLMSEVDPKLKYSIINCVQCTPFTSPSLADIREPLLSEMEGCGGHLLRVINYLKPKWIVALGRIAEKNLKRLHIPHLFLYHPSYIMQSKHDELERARFIVDLKGYICGEHES